jgi:hypothetical protein
MSRIVLCLLTLVVASGCSGGDATAPMNSDVDRALRVQSSSEAPVEVTFTKWITAYPAMAGNTSYGDGTFNGRVLSRIPFDNGVSVKLQARYGFTDPSGDGRSFTAEIHGTHNLTTGVGVLNGIVTEGWRAGSQVHVRFLQISCVPHGVCWQGTVRIQG